MSIFQELTALQMSYLEEMGDGHENGLDDTHPLMVVLVRQAKELNAEIARLEKEAKAIFQRFNF